MVWSCEQPQWTSLNSTATLARSYVCCCPSSAFWSLGKILRCCDTFYRASAEKQRTAGSSSSSDAQGCLATISSRAWCEGLFVEFCRCRGCSQTPLRAQVGTTCSTLRKESGCASFFVSAAGWQLSKPSPLGCAATASLWYSGSSRKHHFIQLDTHAAQTANKHKVSQHQQIELRKISPKPNHTHNSNLTRSVSHSHVAWWANGLEWREVECSVSGLRMFRLVEVRCECSISQCMCSDRCKLSWCQQLSASTSRFRTLPRGGGRRWLGCWRYGTRACPHAG